jgi:hypothetical protein
MIPRIHSRLPSARLRFRLRLQAQQASLLFRLVKIYNYDDDLGLPKFGVLRQSQPKHSEKKCAADRFATQPADASCMRRLKRMLLLVYTNVRSDLSDGLFMVFPIAGS